MASHIVLIGYGESGRVLLRALQFDPRRTRPTVIDVDPAKVEQARPYRDRLETADAEIRSHLDRASALIDRL